MRRIFALSGFVAFLPFTLWAGEQEPKTPKQDYAEFSKTIHGIAVKELPKQFEDATGWGGMIEIPNNLPLMKLRKVVKNGDKLNAPHGPWVKFKGKVEEPNKNLKIDVKEFKKLDAKTYRVVTEVDVIITGRIDYQQWQKGLILLNLDATADAYLFAVVTCDVSASLNFKKIPPELVLEPKVADLKLDLVDIQMRGEPLIKGDKADAIRNDLKEVLRSIVKTSEGFVKDQANQAIVEGLKQGKGSISAGAILKGLPK